jgi:hypothetical protein
MGFIKGQYRDIIRYSTGDVRDSGWKSNSIQSDCGRFFAALLKKDFSTKIGIEYLVVGGPIDPKKTTILYPEDKVNTFSNGFKNRIINYFKDNIEDGNYWVYAAKLEENNISYYPPNTENGNPNKLKISYTFEELSLEGKDYYFKEFSLIGIDILPNGSFKDLYLINYVNHGIITKHKNLSWERSIVLTFPPEMSN